MLREEVASLKQECEETRQQAGQERKALQKQVS